MATPVHDHPHPHPHPDAGATAGAAGGPTAPAWRAPVVAGLVGAGACAAVALWNPGDGGTPLCWSQSVLGIDCPLCGGLRCANALLRGDWLAAADHNVLLAVLLPLVALAWVVWLVRSLRGLPTPRPRLSRSWWIAVAVLLVAFTVVRNTDATPVFSWLHSTTYRS